MKYTNVCLAKFIERPNRFIAHCQLIDTGEEVIAHVKNTGRGKEVFFPGVEVALVYCPSKTRKTDYDLVAIKKKEAWFNIDSQIPNALAADGLLSGQIQLPGISGEIIHLKREKTFKHSKFDIYIETNQSEKIFVEVKGMTLENYQIGAFPDAPSLRGLKHVEELTLAQREGYQCYVLFIIQFEEVKLATIHTDMQPALYTAIQKGKQDGLQVLAYNCHVTPEEILIKNQIEFQLEYPFEDPNKI
ncbi:sugar fermentation stimulation protein [Enterococcus phoeniculicola]|jgi:sugar fermentation stimulation protein A|uniref:Sugar fermentation stimulation protein homolog n=1 Tax=Enterococcus phoeniculicola ATCC BAA-412 TaxID=1158610 RepID=R3WNF2_9ENTE|nr:DNA/RNA nuclease SfsA [Enterococcus phoeniculicola]EOL48947.1 sugar fermentation stimulation protein [Enterococcus phoeniculicola ATCC BAA-412]EOT72793.1 sugar fermentation stimulation protein [Enterococcus phoeniculicola ATCC BAA-412]OJG70841.1 sugar fermentation stimulation protein [Enterococcus phoeniculicola]